MWSVCRRTCRTIGFVLLRTVEAALEHLKSILNNRRAILYSLPPSQRIDIHKSILLHNTIYCTDILTHEWFAGIRQSVLLLWLYDIETTGEENIRSITPVKTRLAATDLTLLFPWQTHMRDIDRDLIAKKQDETITEHIFHLRNGIRKRGRQARSSLFNPSASFPHGFPRHWVEASFWIHFLNNGSDPV